MLVWEQEGLAYGGTQDPVFHGHSKNKMNYMAGKYHMIRFNLE